MIDGCFPLQQANFDKFLDRSHLPDDIEELKDLFVSTTQAFSQEIQDLSQKVVVFCEKIEELQSALSVLRRFQYGQRSERLKKNG